MSGIGDVSLVLGMGVTRGRDKGTVTITQENIYQVPAGTVLYGKLQLNVHAWCGKRAVIGPAGGDASKKGGETAFPGHHEQRNVPWTGDAL